MKPYVDVAIVVPLQEEFERLRGAFEIKAEEVVGQSFLVELDTKQDDLVAVAILQDDMGKAAAGRAADALINRYEIGVILVLGIAGGISGDVAVGDVCFTGSVVDVLENSKVSDSKDGLKMSFNNKFYKTDKTATFSWHYAQLGSDARPLYEQWQKTQLQKSKTLIPNPFIGRSDKYEDVAAPRMHHGTVICGAVSKSDIYKEMVAGADRKTLAIETEAGAVFFSAENANIPAMSVRGVCDYADHNKNLLEEETGENLREIAADNVVTFFQFQLKNPQFRLFLSHRKAQSSVGSLQPAPGDLFAEAIQTVRRDIHAQLSQLSPDYRGKPLGYRSPLPRIKEAISNVGVTPATKRVSPIDILEAITTNRLVVLDVPRIYPDNSLPWLVANEVSLIEIGGDRCLPIVVDGNTVRPPSGTLTGFSKIDVASLIAGGGVMLVFVITDFPANSKSRSEYLHSQMELYPQARFVILTSNELTGGKSELLISTGAPKYSICDISFIEMATFIQRTFSLADQEASVIAYRLYNLFKRFELNAHPSFFAGVGGETLSALLRANRRSELIQLAVGGFLSFVVAFDTDDVVLTRTTRERFLRRLAYEKFINVKTFDQAGLVAFVEEVSAEMDFDINAIKFIQTFQEKGLITFINGRAEISLPFMESYLLASELIERPTDAIKYFDPDNDDFDFNAFDLYAEIGPAQVVVDRIIEASERLAVELKLPEGEKHILLTNDIRPALVDKQYRVQALQSRLEKAFDDVSNNRSHSVEKQRLLDFANRFEEEARADSDIVIVDEDEDLMDPEMEGSLKAFRTWEIAAILLGSGSERMNRDPKRRLAKSLVQLTSFLLHRILKSFPKAGFEKFKERLRDDDEIKKIFGGMNKEIPQDFRDMVDVLMDAYEFSLLSSPVRMMFDNLSNSAGQPVLRTSVSNIEVEGEMENLIARIWSAEMDASKERSALLDSISKLPPFPFLRLTLSGYFIIRVFWSHWDRRNRFALLDAAEETLRPLSQGIDKGRLKRLIDKEEEEKTSIG
ncbi:hypothetical protein NKH52_19285 [Mesorhizobium sp. M1066]|uniref:5'-methylthioadenosine/S-adenosylhomocysteine nucleosidase family protein n=1 Tax=unclassified Mesorhizobium TaxID=325217 RepID=UPI003336FFE3